MNKPARPGLEAILRPRSIAVIGASNRPGTIGLELMRNLLRNEFQGPVYPINPKARAVQSVRAWADIREVPDPVDLAVIALPRDKVLPVAEACIEHGVKGLVVITAGFKELGEEGAALERALVEKARAAGVRLVGPNCLGVVSTDPETRLDATFAPTFPPAGNVAVASQSGALGVAMLDYARDLNIGVSDFVSMGNKADVSGNDLLEWWGRDPRTDVVLLYLESFGNPLKFARIAREVTRSKPVVTVKSGRSTRGLLAASSHTGSLAGTDRAVQALVDETGMIRVDTVEELFDMAAFLAHQPVPRGRRVGILTNAGGPGILATDACEANGLTVPDLPDALGDALRAFLPAEASVRNPVDMIASATPESFEKATRLMLESDALDALIVLFVPPIVTDPEAVGKGIARASAGIDKPVISCFMGRHGVPKALAAIQRAHIPSYAFPESAVRVLARATRYGEWLAREEGREPPLAGFDLEAARAALAAARRRLGGEGWLSPEEVAGVLTAAGIRTPPARVAASAGEAAEVARALGFPVVLKLEAEGVSHKTDVGGVRLNLRNEIDVFDAWEGIAAALAASAPDAATTGALVQPMVTDGVEVIDVELLEDVRFRIPPLTDLAAAELVRSVKGAPLLDGWRGAPAADIPALEDLLRRVGALAEGCPEILEMDLNPVKVLPAGQGCVTVDARIRI